MSNFYSSHTCFGHQSNSNSSQNFKCFRSNSYYAYQPRDTTSLIWQSHSWIWEHRTMSNFDSSYTSFGHRSNLNSTQNCKCFLSNSYEAYQPRDTTSWIWQSHSWIWKHWKMSNVDSSHTGFRRWSKSNSTQNCKCLKSNSYEAYRPRDTTSSLWQSHSWIWEHRTMLNFDSSHTGFRCWSNSNSTQNCKCFQSN